MSNWQETDYSFGKFWSLLAENALATIDLTGSGEYYLRGNVNRLAFGGGYFKTLAEAKQAGEDIIHAARNAK